MSATRSMRGDRLARAITRGGLAGDLGCIVHVVMRHVDRAQGIVDIAQRAQGDLVLLAVEHVKIGDVGGPGAVATFGLDDDLPDLAVEIEVVDVETAQVGLEDREDVGRPRRRAARP